MRTWLRPAWALACKFSKFSVAAGIASLLTAVSAFAQTTEEAGGEAALKLPDLTQVQFLGSMATSFCSSAFFSVSSAWSSGS